MSEKNSYKNFKKFHFTGVLGVSMSALAKHLAGKNYVISGSDGDKNGDFSSLEAFGIKTYKGHSKRFVKGADVVIASSAINSENPELKYAARNNIPVIKRSQLLGEIISEYDRSVCVSGSHGKTTATAMIAAALIASDKDPTVFLGGNVNSYGNYRAGNGQIVVAEACEYKKNFLDIKPKIAVVLNIDNDHLDSYADMDDMTEAFNRFIFGAIAVVNADDKYTKKLESAKSVTFGVENSAVYTAKNIKRKGNGYSFTACAYGKPLGKISLSVIGRHNVYNALATIATCDIMGINFSSVKSALEKFTGVQRRSERIGTINGCEIFADYAHHPKEIAASLSAFHDLDKDFAVIFQPHTYSRTEYLMGDFVTELKNTKELAIYSTYAAREKYNEKGSERALYENIRKIQGDRCSLILTPKELEGYLGDVSKRCNAAVILGAGDIYWIVKRIIDGKEMGV